MARELESLEDMLNAAKQAIQFASEIDLDKLFESKLYQDGIIKELEILAEAGKRLPRDWRESHPEIEWQKLFNHRNTLVHDYDLWDLEEVWRIVTQDMVAMIPTLNSMIAEEARKRGLGDV